MRFRCGRGPWSHPRQRTSWHGRATDYEMGAARRWTYSHRFRKRKSWISARRFGVKVMVRWNIYKKCGVGLFPFEYSCIQLFLKIAFQNKLIDFCRNVAFRFWCVILQLMYYYLTVTVWYNLQRHCWYFSNWLESKFGFSNQALSAASNFSCKIISVLS